MEKMYDTGGKTKKIEQGHVYQSVASSFNNSLLTSVNWGEQLLDFGESNVVPLFFISR